MYEYIKGILTKITAKYIVVETAGIGYLLHVANPYAYSGKMNQEVHVYLHQVVREDAHLLYGFATEEEKKLFLSLISVSGIGPVSALAIIAADDNAGLVQAIETKNITYLTKFPKIGKKTAQQMVLDLEGKVVVAGDDVPAKATAPSSSDNKELEEAMEAMLALGYKATELKKIKKFFEGTTDTAENYIKSALKMLVK
ncbi:Holliday junction branch migration protein RuvA [Streptococcus infantis]|uniref:Holliday junction branch migration protein RuvA n=1 Tax=Streptococcus infantis TaxID=68892 RepID=UPI0039C01586